MAYAQEIPIPQLPEDIDPRVLALFRVWQDARRGDEVPSRRDLTGEKLRPWIDDISIYEYIPERQDFIVRIDSPNMIAASGENYQGCSSRQIDLDFGTTLHSTLLGVVERKQPCFHMIDIERHVWEEWVRLLLPVQAHDRSGKVITQVLAAHFYYRAL